MIGVHGSCSCCDWSLCSVGVACVPYPLVIGREEEHGRGEGEGVIEGVRRGLAGTPWLSSGCGRGAAAVVASPWAVWAQVGVRMPVWAASAEYLHFANSGKHTHTQTINTRITI